MTMLARQQFQLSVLVVLAVFLWWAPREVAAFRVGLFCNSEEGGCDEINGSLGNNFLISQHKALVERFGSENVAWLPFDYTSDEVNEAALCNQVKRGNFNHLITSAPALSKIRKMHSVGKECQFNYSIVDNPFGADDLLDHFEIIVTRDDEVGFLAGVLAGSQTNGSVGMLSGPEYLALKNFKSGFSQGVRKVCPQCIIHTLTLSSFNLKPSARQAADELVAKGADIVFAAAGSAGSAAIRHLANQSVHVIGVDVDEFTESFADATAEEKKFLLSSAVKRSDLGVTSSAESVMLSGEFKPGIRVLTLKDGMVELAPCHDSCDKWTVGAKGETDTIISRGQANTDVDWSNGRVRDAPAVALRSPGLPLDPNKELIMVPFRNYSPETWRVILFSCSFDYVATFDPSSIAWENSTANASTVPPLKALTGITTITVVMKNNVQYGGGDPSLNYTQNFLAAVGESEQSSSTVLYLMSFYCAKRVCGSIFPRWVTANDVAGAPPARTGSMVVQDGSSVVMAGGIIGGETEATAEVWIGRANGTRWQYRDPSIEYDSLPVLEYGEDRLDVLWYSVGDLNYPRTEAVSQFWSPPSDDKKRYLVVFGGNPMAPGVEMFDLVTNTSTTFSADSLHGTKAIGNPIDGWVATLYDPGTQETVRIHLGARSVARVKSTDSTFLADAAVAEIPLSAPLEVATERESPITGEQRVVLQIARGATTTTEMKITYATSFRCNANSMLAVTADGQGCAFCDGTVINGACNPRSSDDDNSAVILYISLPLIFFLGAVIGGLLWYLMLHAPAESAFSRAPKKGTMGVCFVSLVDSASHWQNSPRTMASSIELFRKIVSKSVRTFRAYEVRHIADAHLVVATSPMALVRVGHRIISEMQAADWEDVPLQCRVVVNFGAPNVRFSESSGYDYTGAAIDVTTALAKRFAASQLVITAAAMEQLDIEMLDIPAPILRTVSVPAESRTTRDHEVYVSNIISSHVKDEFLMDVVGPQEQLADNRTANPTKQSQPGAALSEPSQLTTSMLERHPQVIIGVISAKECKKLAQIVIKALRAIFAPLTDGEQRSLLSTCAARMKIPADKQATVDALALAILQQMDLLELPLLIAQCCEE